MTNISMSRRVVTALTLAVLAAGVLTVWALDGSSTATAAEPSEAYAVLKCPGTPDDGLRGTAVPISRLAGDQPSVDVGAARRLTTDAGDVVALVPRRDGKLCLHIVRADGSASGACRTPRRP